MILLRLDRIHPSSNSKSFSFLWNLFTKIRLFSQWWSEEDIIIGFIFRCLLSAEDSNFVKLGSHSERRLTHFLPQFLFISTVSWENRSAVNKKSVLQSYKSKIVYEFAINYKPFFSIDKIDNKFSLCFSISKNGLLLFHKRKKVGDCLQIFCLLFYRFYSVFIQTFLTNQVRE